MATITFLLAIATVFFIFGVMIIAPYIFLNEPAMKIMKGKIRQDHSEIQESKRCLSQCRSESESLRIQLEDQMQEIKANEQFQDKISCLLEMWKESRW